MSEKKKGGRNTPGNYLRAAEKGDTGAQYIPGDKPKLIGKAETLELYFTHENLKKAKLLSAK